MASTNPTFAEFYGKFGFTKYPFSTYTAENETENRQSLFVEPADYEPVKDTFTSGVSIVLRGNRGTGKTMFLLDLAESASAPDALIVQIDDYAALPLNYNTTALYTFFVCAISTALFGRLVKRPSIVRRASAEDKVLLSYLMAKYLQTSTKTELQNKIKATQLSLAERAVSWFYNRSRRVLNYGATVGANIVEELSYKHLTGLPRVGPDYTIREFFPEVPSRVMDDFVDPESTFSFLLRVLDMSKRLGFSRNVVFLDKIDEDNRFNNDAEPIAEFLRPLLADSKLILSSEVQLVVAVWSMPYNFLTDSFRTNKHYCPTIDWTSRDLERALDRRLETYSDGNVRNTSELFSPSNADTLLKRIFHLCNRNPRDLWHVMDKVFREQYGDIVNLGGRTTLRNSDLCC
jgi:hypothetical protein